jgi:hypothetical protein
MLTTAVKMTQLLLQQYPDHRTYAHEVSAGVECISALPMSYRR